MNNNKKIWIGVIAVVAIIVIVALAGKYTGKSGGTVVENNTHTPEVPAVIATSTGAKATTTASGTVKTNPTPTSAAKTFNNGSYAFSYPNSWIYGSVVPTSINNFNGVYEKGGVIPMGGAEIDIATTTLYSGRIQDILGTELLSSTNVVTSTITIKGVSCVEANYTGVYVAGVASQNTALYCLRGTELWKIYLSHRLNDPQIQSILNVWNSFLASFKFLP